MNARYLLVSVCTLLASCTDKAQRERVRDDDAEDRRASPRGSDSVSISMSGATTASASSLASGSTSSNQGLPRPGQVPVEITKTFRARSCYFGALTLRQVRAVYVASLGGKTPAPGSAPRFGIESSSSSSRDAVKPRTWARHCQIALAARGGEDKDFDAVLAPFFDYVHALTWVVEEGSHYYAAKEYDKDGWARGKTFHACLTSTGTCEDPRHNTITQGFGSLDTRLEALKTALDRYVLDHPVDSTGFTPSQTAAGQALAAAEEVLLAFLATAPDEKWVLRALGALDTRISDLSGSSSDNHLWTSRVAPTLDEYRGLAKELAIELGAHKTVAPARLIALSQLHQRILERDYSATQMNHRRSRLPKP